MANVVMPQSANKDKSGALLGMASLIPGPVGGVAMGLNAAKQLSDKGPAAAPDVAAGRSAIQRRAQTLQPLNPADYGADLAAAEQAATQLPPDLQKQYMPALQAARARSQGVA